MEKLRDDKGHPQEDFGNDSGEKLTFLWENRIIWAISELPVTLNELEYNLNG